MERRGEERREGGWNNIHEKRANSLSMFADETPSIADKTLLSFSVCVSFALVPGGPAINFLIYMLNEGNTSI